MWRLGVAGAVLALAWFAATRTGLAADAVETALATCWSCHGDRIPPKDPTIPLIQGQRAAYLEKQLLAFRDGTREDQIMSSMAASIPRPELARASTLIAAMPWPKPKAAAPASAPETVAACQACHGPDLAGGASPEGDAPRIAGQFAEYLEERMVAFARGDQPAAKTMTIVMKGMSAAERAALAKYLAEL